MSAQVIHLQGLNLRVSDREAAPGVCRELKNLYPSGSVEAPLWKPAAAEKLYFEQGQIEDERFPITAGYAWFRANQGAQLVYLGIGENGFDVLRMVHLDESGNVIPSSNILDLWNFADTSNARDARFAQVGDTLVIAITRNGEPEEMLVVSNGENNTTICFPYNLPALPTIIHCPDNMSGSGALKYFGFRYGYELVDGSIVNLSNVVLRLCTGNGTVGDTSVHYFGNYTDFVKVSAPILPESRYKNIIKGIAVFISDGKDSIVEVLSDALYYKFGLIVDVLGSGEKKLDIEFLDTDLIALPLLEEDILAVHNIFASETFSYNRNLLLANIQYDFQKPFNPNNMQSKNIPPSIYIAPSNLILYPQRDDTTHLLHHVLAEWESNNADAEKVLQTIVQVKKYFTATVSTEWFTLYAGNTESVVAWDVRNEGSVHIVIGYNGYPFLEVAFRVRFEYKDGGVSDWIEGSQRS